MVVAHEAEGACSPGTAQPGPRGWRNEDGPRSRRKNRVIERTPGTPGRPPSLALVRPRSVLCAGISRILHSHILTGKCSSTGASMSGLASGERAGASAWPRHTRRRLSSHDDIITPGIMSLVIRDQAMGALSTAGSRPSARACASIGTTGTPDTLRTTQPLLPPAQTLSRFPDPRDLPYLRPDKSSSSASSFDFPTLQSPGAMRLERVMN
jgi:hypothetical protein